MLKLVVQSATITHENSTGPRVNTQCMCAHAQSCPTLCDPMDSSPPASLSMGFSRQEYRRGLPFLSPGDLPNPGVEPTSLACLALPGGFFTTVSPGKPSILNKSQQILCSQEAEGREIALCDGQG